MTERIPFEEAINEPLLLKKAWVRLARPMQSALRVFYGLPLDEQGLRDLSVFMEQATFDDLGYVRDAQPYPNYHSWEHEEAFVIFGRKAAKTSGFLSFVIAYEALLGGHTQFASKKQQVVSFVVAQKLDIAQAIIRDFIEPLISSSKLLEKEIVDFNIHGILLKNSHRIAPAPPVIKNFRYFAIPVGALDECAFWYKDAESANPDYEVIRAITPAQAQFPYRKLIGTSTIWTKEGIIWEAKQAGCYGNKLSDEDEGKAKFKSTLVLIAPTPALENPLLADRKWFEREMRKDPDAYHREILNEATDAIGGMFSETLMRQATDTTEMERKVDDTQFYIAALDPAFRGDDFAFTIGHYEPEKGFIQDYLKAWSPRESKLNPAEILDEVKVKLDEYHVEMVYSDQYQLESLQQLALDRQFSIVGMDFTANSKSRMFGSFLQLLRNNRVKLLHNRDQFQQFMFIQRIVGHGGYIRVSAPIGKHDDLVMVTVLCAAMAIRFEPDRLAKQADMMEKTPFQQIMATIASKRVAKDEYL